MQQLFAFDQGVFLGAPNTLPALAAHGEGACLGLSLLWVRHLHHNVAQTYRNYLAVQANQRRVAEWMNTQEHILGVIEYAYKLNGAPISNIQLAEGRENNKQAYLRRKKELRMWASFRNIPRLTLVWEDTIRFANVIPHSPAASPARWRRAATDLIAADLQVASRRMGKGLLATTETEGGHAMGFRTRVAGTSIALFDPNFGEYELDDRTEISNFLFNHVITDATLEHWWIVGFA